MASVLLVDDDPDVLESLGEWLARRHQVRVARGFVEALALLVKGPLPNVVITDYEMPPYRGDDLLAIVAARYPRVCRILHTGTPGALLAAATVHADHVLPKGVELAVLDALVERAVRRA
jgi:DNA-binding NtrC family response regulator